MNRAMSTGAETQIDSYKDQRHPFAVTAYALIKGPRDASEQLVYRQESQT